MRASSFIQRDHHGHGCKNYIMIYSYVPIILLLFVSINCSLSSQPQSVSHCWYHFGDTYCYCNKYWVTGVGLIVGSWLYYLGSNQSINANTITPVPKLFLKDYSSLCYLPLLYNSLLTRPLLCQSLLPLLPWLYSHGLNGGFPCRSQSLKPRSAFS